MNEISEKLKPFWEALKSGKTLSFCFFEDGGYTEEFYYKIKYSTDTEKFNIEEKNVLDRGYPDIDITFNNFEMTTTAFKPWFEKNSVKSKEIKIE